MNTLLLAIEYLAVLAAALSGTLEARSKKMDLVGVYFVALATALGGGTARDMILDRHPIFWVQHYHYIVSVLAFALIGILFAGRGLLPSRRVTRAIDICDAIGLGLFSMVGASYALQSGCSRPVSVLIGVVNGIFGGILRDITCNEIPAVFRQNTQLYATCAFLGSIAYICLMWAGVGQGAAFVSGLLLTFAVRLLAIRFNVGLPL